MVAQTRSGRMGHNTVEYIRTVSEAMKAATADKDAHVGDPAFYGRFGFQPAGPLGYTNDFHDGDAFQVLTLRTGKRIPSGHLLYAEPFNALK